MDRLDEGGGEEEGMEIPLGNKTTVRAHDKMDSNRPDASTVGVARALFLH